jgi:endonuclease/exonuclease/phosphatase family metal-dependent hydrolase
VKHGRNRPVEWAHLSVKVQLAAAAVLVVFLASACATSRPATSGKVIRVMTWNIHHAEGTDHKVDVKRIAKVILSERPDVVALQEVDRGVERSGKIDMITTLADLMDMTYAFGKTLGFQGGDYGNAFLTRFPILEERNILYKTIEKGEQRGRLQLLLDVRGEEVIVADTHLESRPDDTARVTSVEDISTALTGYGSRPVVVCGDFNDTPESRTIRQMKKDFADSWAEADGGTGFTFPSDEPGKRIDYIFTLNKTKPDSLPTTLQLRPLSARVLESSASDHLPLVVEFEIRTER